MRDGSRQQQQKRATGTLYVVATPIGNLEDITPRALRILGEVELVACEDTRRTSPMLRHFGLPTRVESYHRFSERRKLERFVERLRAGGSVALVSDAGTPGLSDPGALLVAECRREGIPVVAVPGASALLAALACSSFAGRPFLFWGFLPSRSRQRRDALRSLAGCTFALVFYESPVRLTASLRDIQETLGDRHIFLGRELTKAFEETLEGPVSEILEQFSDRKVLGEVTLIVEGRQEEAAEGPDLETAAGQARELARAEGLSRKEACRRVAARTGHPVRALYQQMLGKE